MKYIPQVLFIQIPLFCFFHTSHTYIPYQGINYSIKVIGGNSYNSDESISYSLTQVFHLNYNEDENGVQEGVQHPLVTQKIEQIFHNSVFPNTTVNFITIKASSLSWSLSSIKADILKNGDEIDTPKTSNETFLTSKNIYSDADVDNILAFTSSAPLTITSEFSDMNVDKIYQLEVSNTTLIVKGTFKVIINDHSGCNGKIGNVEVYTGGLVRKTVNNSYILL